MKAALLDANILTSAWLTDVLLSLDEALVIEVYWSKEIVEEAQRALERIGHAPNSFKPYFDCLGMLDNKEVAATYTPVVPALPDPNDRHVLASALAAGASYIVTYNLSDFPASALETLGIEAVHPDAFLRMTFDESPEEVLTVLGTLVAVKRRPPRTMEEELRHLRKIGLHTFAERIENAW